MTLAPFPFSALVGQADLTLALLVNAVSPAVGGVLVRGEKGTAKSTAVRGLARLLPDVEVVEGCAFNCDPGAPAPDCPSGPHEAGAAHRRRPVPLVELPVGASADRVAGALDLERALSAGHRAFEPGLLAAAHRGILYVDEVNLLGDHLVDLLLDAAALGTNHVERDGVSVRHPSRFLLVGTMNPEEGELRPQLLDRFGLTVDVRGNADVAERVEIVRRRLAYEADPAQFAAAWAGADADLGRRVRAAAALLPSVGLPDPMLERIAAACAAFAVDGLRGDVVTARTAVALAAWAGRDQVTLADVRQAALLALPHRRRRGPLDAPGLDENELDRVLGDEPEPPDGPPGDGRTAGPEGAAADGALAGDRPTDAPAGRSAAPTRQGSAATPEAPTAEHPSGPEGGAPGRSGSLEESTHPAGGAEQPTGEASSGQRVAAPASLFVPVRLELPGAGGGVAGRRSRARGEQGMPVADRAGGAGTLSLAATLRAAAPHQAARGRTPGAGIVLGGADLRWQVREGREGNLVLFVVDASGSMAARERMAQTKGAVLSLLVDAYQRRDRVGLVAFRGAGAEVLLPPTSSVELAARRLADLPTGGRTPLAAGLDRAATVLATERARDPRRRPLLVVVTDGRLPGPRASRVSLPEAVVARAHALVKAGVGAVVIDTEDGPVRLGLAGELAEALAGPCLRLEELAGLVRAVAGAGRRRVA